jgi:hypothetical protein
MTDQTDQDLIKAAREEIMGVTLAEGQIFWIGNGHAWQRDPPDPEVFNPLTNSNHTDMLRDKLVEMGFGVDEALGPAGLDIYIYMLEEGESETEYVNGFCALDSINKTRTQAYVTAMRKYNETN